MKAEDNYWSDMELRLELMQGLDACSLRFQEQLRQILLDMRLYREPTDSILRMVIRLMERTNTENRQIFLNNAERVAFDPRLAPEHSEAFVHFLTRMQQLSQARL